MTTKQKPPVLVLDFHRGIYFGRLVRTLNKGRSVVLEQMRHCFYYPVAEAGNKGVYGLATVGPAEGAKVGPPVTATIHDVAKIVDCSPEAVARWEAIKW